MKLNPHRAPIPTVYTVEEIAEQLRGSLATIRHPWRPAGDIPFRPRRPHHC
jgi:hypothetical protein